MEKKIISSIIVENNFDKIQVLKMGVDSFNKSNDLFEIKVLDALDSVESAKNYLSQESNIEVVFLDFHLNTAIMGYELWRDYPALSYLVISANVKVHFLNSEKMTHKIGYCESISESAWGIEEIVLALNKFISQKS